MTKAEFTILNHLYERGTERKNELPEVALTQILSDSLSYERLVGKGYIDRHSGKITAAGIQALEPYRVDNAIIMAAGASTRFVPLSLEKPKGLYEVKGKRLIDRQIEQLQEAGIKDITVVLGYKKEMFFYLKEKYQVKFIFNAAYNIKNNIESLYLARNEMKNTYICSCDNYFMDNPFHQYEYQSFYAGVTVRDRTNEMYVETDEQMRIVEMKKGKAEGLILMGHAFWQKPFASKFLELAEADRSIGMYDSLFWEWLVNDHLPELPPFYLKEYAANVIFEFDYFDELRKFDEQYIHHTQSKIISNIQSVFHCEEAKICHFRKVEEGMTNTSFIFQIDGVDYIYRHPGDGTENIINRSHEKRSLEIAKEWGFDPTYVYMDINEGWKISIYIPSFREPDYQNFDDTEKILAVLRRLHAIPVSVDYGMRPWEDALTMEELLVKKDPSCFHTFYPLKEKIGKLYQMTKADGVKKCFCHGDTYRPNWMIKADEDVILIDWEYSGYSDPGIDIGYYIVDAMYEFDQAEQFIRAYLKEDYNEQRCFHYMAYTAIIAYYWFVWAMYRESCGAIMGESLYQWYEMAKKYADHLL